MTLSPTSVHTTPPALITHIVATLRGDQHADLSVHHARTPDARIAVTFSGILMVLYSCHAAQGLLEAFTAARGHIAAIPRELPPPPADPAEPFVRTTVSVEWTRRPHYAATAQMTLNQKKDHIVHWTELYTGPITWRIRDQRALLSTLETLTEVHRTATAVFLDGNQYSADPADTNFPAA
ncbi:hypothetical protein FHT40_006129 [Mycolicibacterium sp. BK556]|uniref:hypothetical protein n=1 Tax=unclassified Mycolicibacterium TaxID=2636767 RepID=UPI001620FCC9|nr:MULTISPECIES: hypothetical protein [unclassified Mycolicibacterium]MBB3606438.1 hypothetical protein [Mycolicibacterium sp. BK556]MBB3636316.1 hypothetical protein [Mycolicibacterium sp. BK607]